MQQFLKDFPNNWRRETAEYYAVRSLYDQRHDDPAKLVQFLEESSYMINRYPRGTYADDLLCMQAASLIRTGKPDQARGVLGFLQDNFPNSERRDEYPRLWMDTYLNNLVFKKEDVQNVLGLDRCYNYAERFIAEGQKELSYKYTSYCARYAVATKGKEALEGVFERLEHYAREKKESMLPLVLMAKSDYYWDSGEYAKSVEVARDLLEGNCPPRLRGALIEKIAGHMARTGVENQKIKEFLGRYRR